MAMWFRFPLHVCKGARVSLKFKPINSYHLISSLWSVKKVIN
jgi:hypothetical protein